MHKKGIPRAAKFVSILPGEERSPDAVKKGYKDVSLNTLEDSLSHARSFLGEFVPSKSDRD